FVGEWSDSLGNDVRVVSSGRGIEVKLQKANGRGKEISLTIKKAAATLGCGEIGEDETPALGDFFPPGNFGTSSSSTSGPQAIQEASEVWRPPSGPPSGVGVAPPVPVRSVGPGGHAWASPPPDAWAGYPSRAKREEDEPDLSNVLDFLASAGVSAAQPAVKQELEPTGPVSGLGADPRRARARKPDRAPGSAAPNSPLSDATVPSDGEEAAQSKPPQGAAAAQQPDRWSEVLEMLAAAAVPEPAVPPGVVYAVGQMQQQQQQQQQQEQQQQQQWQQGQMAPIMGQPFMQAPPGMHMGMPMGQPVPGAVAQGQQHMVQQQFGGVGVGMTMGLLPGVQPLPQQYGGGASMEDLFSSFNLPQNRFAAPAPSGALAAAAAGITEEALREQVLTETLQRLLREKTGSAVASSPWRRQAEAAKGAEAASAPAQETASPAADAAAASRDPRLAGRMLPPPPPPPPGGGQEAQVEERQEAPLDKFIKIFGLDELAAKCLQRLQDDEAAYVIESCQHRLKHAANPSAVVMIAIKGVAAKVGRRYHQLGQGGEGVKGDQSGELKMFEGSPADDEEAKEEDEEEDEADGDEGAELAEPVEADGMAAATDPYGVAAVDPYGAGDEEFIEEEEEEEEEVKEVDQEVEVGRQAAAPLAATPKTVQALNLGQTATGPALNLGQTATGPAAKRRKTSDGAAEQRLTVEVLPPPQETVAVADEEEAEDADMDNLFFVDTGAS
ncbi:unnamed protein product, partial [Polarella glacialis]